MFPPMTPMGERIRAEHENRQIEQSAAMRAQTHIGRLSTFGMLRRTLANLLPQGRPACEQTAACRISANAVERAQS